MLAKVALVKFAHGLTVSTCHVTKQPQTARNVERVSRQPNRSNTPSNREGGNRAPSSPVGGGQLASWRVDGWGPAIPYPAGRNRLVCQFPPDCQPGVDTKGTLTYHTPIPLKDGRVADSENTPMSQNARYGGVCPPPRGWVVCPQCPL